MRTGGVVTTKGSSSPGAVPAAPRASRTGRNLPAAIAVGVAMGAAIIASLVLLPQAWVVIVAVAMAVATWEVSTAVATTGVRVALAPLLVGGQAMIWLGWVFGTAGVLDAMRTEMPDRFYMEGVSEQAIIGIAAGMAMDGYIPYINTIATFQSGTPFTITTGTDTSGTGVR